MGVRPRRDSGVLGRPLEGGAAQAGLQQAPASVAGGGAALEAPRGCARAAESSSSGLC